LERLRVQEIPASVPDMDVLIGRDVLSQCLLIADGPAGQFTLAD
jgi:hypothetical protein